MGNARGGWLALAMALAGCTSAPRSTPLEPPAETAASAAPRPPNGLPTVAAAPEASTPGSSTPGVVEPAEAETPRIGPAAAEKVLFLDEVPAEAAACREREDDQAAVRCMLELRYAADPAAAKSALSLYDQSGDVAGLEVAHAMDGGWRGQLQLVPELPIGRHRRHLAWIAEAAADFDAFFEGLQGQAQAPLRYRHEPLELKFFRSVGRTTPSAYASGWSVAYNVSGSLHGHAEAVRETLFHEIFHLNDRAHDHWSARTLTPLYDAIVERCSPGGKLVTRCLTPYAPNHTMVRGGTYYAFQPGNGVWEYAAELAIRYYREQRALLAGKAAAGRPFKCGGEPNPRAWQLLVDEFFGGTDLSPACR